MSHSHIPNSPIWRKPRHFISNLNDSYQNGACADLYKIALSPTRCPTPGGGDHVTFLKLSADQLIIFLWLSLIFVCRYLFCLQWLEIYCFNYQVFNRSAPLQRYYYLVCFIELVSVQRHFCCPAHFYSETSLGPELTSNFCLPLKFAHNPTLLSDRARQFIATTIIIFKSFRNDQTLSKQIQYKNFTRIWSKF